MNSRRAASKSAASLVKEHRLNGNAPSPIGAGSGFEITVPELAVGRVESSRPADSMVVNGGPRRLDPPYWMIADS